MAVKSLDPEVYLRGDNPLGWALAVRMRRGRMGRPALVLQSLARITRAGLSDMKKVLLLNCVKMYGKLNRAEEAQMQAMMETEEYRDVREVELTWSEQLESKGEKKGQRKAVLDLCEAFDIPLTAAQSDRIANMELDELESLRAHLKRHRAWPR